MPYSNAGGQQRGPLSDQRHGKAHAETIAGRRGARFLTQLAAAALILLGVAGLYMIAAFLGSEDPGLRAIAWIVIGLVGVVAVALEVRRRSSRQHLDDVLRSRRRSD